MGDFPFKSKTFWAGAILILKAIVYDIYYRSDYSTAVTELALGSGMIGLRQAVQK